MSDMSCQLNGDTIASNQNYKGSVCNCLTHVSQTAKGCENTSQLICYSICHLTRSRTSTPIELILHAKWLWVKRDIRLFWRFCSILIDVIATCGFFKIHQRILDTFSNLFDRLMYTNRSKERHWTQINSKSFYLLYLYRTRWLANCCWRRVPVRRTWINNSGSCQRLTNAKWISMRNPIYLRFDFWSIDVSWYLQTHIHIIGVMCIIWLIKELTSSNIPLKNAGNEMEFVTGRKRERNFHFVYLIFHD